MHAPVWLLAPSQCSLPHGGHSLLTLKRALMTVLQTTAAGSDARDLSMTLFFPSSSVCAEKQPSSHRSLFAKVQKQIATCRYAGLGCITLSCNCYCHATVVMPFWLFLLCSGPNKNNPRMPLCPKTSYGTLFLDAEQLQTIKQYGAWVELSSLLPWAHMQCSPGLFLASVGADLRLRMGECPSVLQVRFTADPKGAYSKQYSTSMWAAQPFQKSGWYLMANLCRAPWLQCLWLLRRCSHAYAE